MNERKGKPSASHSKQYSLCPGSFKLCQQVPADLVPAAPKETADGSLIHDWLDGSTVELGEHTDVAEKMKTAASDFVSQLLDAYAAGGFEQVGLKTYNETRLWLTSGLRPVFSGKPDLCQVIQFKSGDSTLNVGIIADYKTGFIEVDPAEDNLQLRNLAVLLNAYEDLDQVHVAIVQRQFRGVRSSYAQYDRDGLADALGRLQALLTEIHEPNARRIAGADQCRYCAAKNICHEYHQWITQDMTPAMRETLTIQKWTADQWRQYIEKRGELKKHLEQLDAIALEMVQKDLNSIPGTKLSKPRRITAVPSALAAYWQFKDSISIEDFLDGYCKTTESQLKTLHKATGGTDDDFETKTADVITVTEGARSLSATKRKVRDSKPKRIQGRRSGK